MRKCSARCICLAVGMLIGVAIVTLLGFILRGCIYIWCW